jgi:hypothetical protein
MGKEMIMDEIRPRPTIYEVARRYAACLYALSDVLGITPLDMLTRHREVVTATFMQASREGIRISSSVNLPKLTKLYTPPDFRNKEEN